MWPRCCVVGVVVFVFCPGRDRLSKVRESSPHRQNKMKSCRARTLRTIIASYARQGHKSLLVPYQYQECRSTPLLLSMQQREGREEVLPRSVHNISANASTARVSVHLFVYGSLQAIKLHAEGFPAKARTKRYRVMQGGQGSISV